MESKCIETDWGRMWRNSKGDFHRENDLPALEDSRNGAKAWCINGKYHRELGPARMWIDGDERWYLNGIQYFPENFPEEMPIKLFMAYCNWEYKKKNGI